MSLTFDAPRYSKLRSDYDGRYDGSAIAPLAAPVMSGLVWVNNWMVRHFDDIAENPVPHERLPWSQRLLADTSAIMDEWHIFRSSGGRLPHIEDVFDGHQGNEGSWWRGGPIVVAGRPIEFMAEVFPATTGALLRVPGMHSAMWSVMGPGTRLPPHTGANAGGLRCLIGVSCRDGAVLQIGDRRFPFTDGDAIFFDDTQLHAAYNDSDEERVVILCDIVRPVPSAYRSVNTAFQYFHHAAIPRFRRSPSRAVEWYRALNPSLGAVPTDGASRAEHGV